MLYIHTSNHLEQLKKQYAELVKKPLDDVFKTETVIVQNAGMARWLSIEMAQTAGISANTEYLFPAEFMWRLLRLVSPDIPEHSQCAPDTLRFHIFEELINHFDDYPELHHYILKKNNDDESEDRRLDQLSTWELSSQTAQLLDQYLFYRGEWINTWESDNSAQNKHHSDHWQARLWNRCVKDKGLLHWLKLQTQFSENIDSFDPSLLSERICFFSMSALSPGYIDLLKGISTKTDIHIFIINPCGDVYWGDIQSPKTFAKLDQIEQSYSDIGNPLLASLGKQGRDFIDKLISIQDQQTADDSLDSLDNEITNKQQANTLLAQIQQDIYYLEQPKIINDFDDNDDSLQFHSCHTAMREVEVLHDQILAQLDSDENLAPSDIVVMMPDIEKYAPYIESVFNNAISSNSSVDKKQKLPFSIADRDPQNIFKIVQALNKLFTLADTRFDVEAVFELLEYDDIRKHFGLNQDQLNYCRELALATNIRWGISDKSRQQNDLPNTEEHTWKYALDRMLLGYAIFDTSSEFSEQLFKSNRNLNLLPYKEIEGSNALVLAKFKKFTDALFAINHWLKQAYTLDKWISKTIDLLQQISPENSDQERIFKTLANIQVKSDLADFNEELSFNVYQKLLQHSLSEITANEKYLGYGITFCALVPMRSVPFKIVALMGMNDGEFPRQESRPSFDLMANQTRRGDRSRRDEDRYLFLESILAARKKLIISFIGQSIKDNTEQAPSILVSELLDTVTINSGIKAEDWIVKHPLQAFSRRYFQTDLKSKHPLFSYASQYLQLEQASEKKNDVGTNELFISEPLLKSKHPLFSYASQYLQLEQASEKKNDVETNELFISEPLEALDDEYKMLTLSDLISFFKNPARAFLKTRFGIQSYDDDRELKIREPFAIESFKDREIRNLILANCSDEADKQLLARAKGLLPYGEIGDAIFAKEKYTIEAFEEQLPELEQLSDISILLKIGDFELHATIDQLSVLGLCVKLVSKPYAGDYIDLWITHLCLNAYLQQTGDDSIKPQTQFYSPEKSFQLNSVDDAQQQLTQLLEYYWQGLHFPLPFFPKSSFALYNNTGKKNFGEMDSKWNGNDRYAGEKDSFEHWLLHRELVLNKETQAEDFIQISENVFEKMFSVLSEL